MPVRPHVVVLGGGFGGLAAARGLDRRVRVTLLDRTNHHLFQPLLYQVALATLAASDIAWPIRRIFWRQRHVTVLMAEATGVDLPGKRVLLADGALAYDYLVVATGATHSYFGRDAWAEHAPGLKTLEDAIDVRRRVLMAFEAAEREEDAARRERWLTFVVVGAGPTGVELAGTLAEVAHHTLARDFRRIDPRTTRVLLVEGTDRVLPPFPPELSEKAAAQLRALGVEIRTGAMVTDLDGDGIRLGAERVIAGTVLWAAGVAASPLGRALGVPLDRAGRVKVAPELTLPGRSDVFVIGDLASLEQDGKPIPGVAPAALQMGRHAAANVLRAVAGQPLAPFRYVDKGSLATIGRRAAVADLGYVKLSGFLAWVAWLAIHIFFLIGFRNRFAVIFEWAWAYFTHERSARLILVPRQPGTLPKP
jgi:NADH dehydrogenase